MHNITIGLLAHVDSGKTTLSESLLYHTNMIHKLGRVDHQDTMLDYNPIERKRGITIFSKLSYINYQNYHLTLVDTPGHIDFSGEMERSLSILDYALLIIDGNDKLQNHTKTLLKLCKSYDIPTFIFINKMDISHTSINEWMIKLNELDGTYINMHASNDEELAYVNESLMNQYIDTNKINFELIKQAFNQNEFYPVYYGSSLKNDNIDFLFESILSLIEDKSSSDNLKATVYKIDNEKERITYLKINSGTIHVKDEIGNEKINQIRQYQGQKYELLDVASTGQVVGVTGLNNTYIGQIIGEESNTKYHIEPYLTYQMHIPQDEKIPYYLDCLNKLKQEEPLLNIQIENSTSITISLMGPIQIEIIKQLIEDRYNFIVSIDHQTMNYKETITEVTEGVGHFEPLRHYAEVHLLLEPMPRNTGIIIENKCQTNIPIAYQKAILKILETEKLEGILNNYPLTDIKISLVSAKHHAKHTEGGDFKEATMRALRHGLMKNKMLLLEPYVHYQIQTNQTMLSSIYYEFEAYDSPTIINQDEINIILEGNAPLSFIQSYQEKIYGKDIQLEIIDTYYDECKEEILFDYNPELDPLRQPGSIFCKHGSGYYVEWYNVEEEMHLSLLTNKKQVENYTRSNHKISDEEVKRVFESIYGKPKEKTKKQTYGHKKEEAYPHVKLKPQILLIDGYNVIFSDEEISQIAKTNLANARDKLIDLVVNYQAYTNIKTILVFDAYKVSHPESIEEYGNITLVYTKEAETADSYIEKATKKHAKDYRITVVTSDNLEQTIIMGHGAYRRSSREFLLEANHLFEQNKQYYKK